MNILSHFFSKTLIKTSSAFSRDISVIEHNGLPELRVNGILQTGPYDIHIFDTSFEHFQISTWNSSRGLVLGVGGGYVITKLKYLFPNIVITAVDIDGTIIEIAKKYFHLGNIKNVSYVTENAKTFVERQAKEKKQYDCIIVDLYIGDDIPVFFKEKIFFEHLRQLLGKKGKILINYQGTESYLKKKNNLYRLLLSLFSIVRPVQIKRNVFILVENPLISS